MDFSWEQLIAFIQEQWWVILIAAAVLIIVIKVVKALVKWVIVAAIIVGLVLYGMNYEPIREVVDSVAEYSLDAAFQAMIGEGNEATYTVEDDGTYVVESKSVKLTGRLDSDKVTIYFHGVKLPEVSISGAIETYIEAAKGSAE